MKMNNLKLCNIFKPNIGFYIMDLFRQRKPDRRWGIIALFLLLLVNHKAYSWPKYALLETETNKQKGKVFADLINRSQDVMYSFPDSAIRLARQANETAIRQNNYLLQIQSLNLLGILYDGCSKFDTALDYYHRALSLAVKINDYDQMGNSCNNIGITHWNTGNFKDGFYYLFKALTYYEKSKKQVPRIKTLLNIAVMYGEAGNFIQAKNYTYQAKRIIRIKTDTENTGTLYINLGFLWMNLNYPDSALYYFDQSIQYCKAIKNNTALCLSYEGKARTYLKENNTTKAKESFLLCKLLSEKTSYNYALARAYVGLSQIALLENDTDKAIDDANRALAIAGTMGDIDLDCLINSVLSKAYEKAGQFRKALEYSRSYERLKDQLNDQNKLIQAYSFDIQQINEQNQNQVQQLLVDKQSLNISRKNAMMRFMIIIFAILLIGGYLFFRSYRHKQKLLMENTLLQFAEKRSKATIDAEYRERKRIGKELHDGIGQILSVARLNVSVLQQKTELTDERKKELLEATINSVDKAFHEVRNISHNLASYILTEKGFVEALKDLVDQVNTSNRLTAQIEIFGINSSLGPIMENMLFRAIQELLNNVINHAKASSVFIQVVQNEKEINIMVEDNGKGFEKDQVLARTEGGLNNIRSRVEHLKGSIFIDSMINRGTIVTLVVPISEKSNVSEENTDNRC